MSQDFPRRLDRRRVLQLGGVCLTMLPASGCAALGPWLRQVIQEPKVALQRVVIENATLTEVGARFDVQLENPNPFGFALAGAAYALALQGKRVVRGDIDHRIELPARGKSRIPVPVRFPLGEGTEAILRLMQRKEVDYELATRFRFRWWQGIFEVPVRFRGTLPVPQVPKVEIRDFRFTSVGPEGLRVRVIAQVENGNPFPLPIDRFQFSASLNGRTVLRNERIEDVRLAPRQSRDFRLEFRVGLLEAGLGLLSLAERPELAWEVQAELTSGVFQLPLRLHGRTRLR